MATTQLFPQLFALVWLIFSLILVTLPHLSRLPIWVIFAFFVLLLWRYVITKNQLPLPSKYLKIVLAMTIFIGVVASYASFGRDTSVTLLVILCALKFIEMNSQRDALLICFLGYFLIVTNFLYSQSIPTAIYMGIVMLIMTATLISLTDRNNQLSTQQRLKLSTTLLLQALPLMLVLFVLFPRVAGPFWSLPKSMHSGMVGLSDHLSMGNISELTLSDEIAFRVKFDNDDIPPPSERYWRGPVLWQSDGRDWKVNYWQQLSDTAMPFERMGKSYQYTVTLEPHNERWLFALDLPATLPTELPTRMNQEYQILSRYPVQQRVRYQVRSYTHYHVDKDLMIQNIRWLALSLPKGKHPEARKLAAQWKRVYQTPEKIIQRALRYFHEEEFYYTLMPPLLIDDPVDEFLFTTKQGFCEHYAASFTVLMRAAGIPTRIVLGYLGGELNTVGDYLVVRQRDAHAWAEVWLQDKGWVRVDPTSAVEPGRIEQGLDTVFPDTFSPLGGFGVTWNKDSVVAKLWEEVRNSWDAINNGWNQWILGYDPSKQLALLKSLGWQWREMVIALTVIIIGIVAITALFMFLYPQRAIDPAQRLYLRFCQQFTRRGLSRQPHEAPTVFAHRVKQYYPELTTAIDHIIQLYMSARYAEQTEKIEELRQAVRQFQVPKSA